MSTYEVELHSEPGMWTYYATTVSVRAENDAQAAEKAKSKLAGVFHDRPRNSWIVDGVSRSGRYP